MKNWVCERCGQYKKVKPNGLKTGRMAYFYKNENRAGRTFSQIVRGVVLRMNDDFITILGTQEKHKVSAHEVFLDETINDSFYSSLSGCEC